MRKLLVRFRSLGKWALMTALSVPYMLLVLWMPLLLVFCVVVYAVTFGSDVQLRAACSEDNAFVRFRLLVNGRDYWQSHIAHLDQRIDHFILLPAEIDGKVSEIRRSIEASGAREKYTDNRTEAQQRADALRREADKIEAAEDSAAFRQRLEQQIRDLRACRTAALTFLKKEK